MAGRSAPRSDVRISARQIAPVTIVFLAGLIVLAAGAMTVPDSSIVETLARWARMSVGTFTADAPELRAVTAAGWRDGVSEALASGRGFVSLHALDETGSATVRALFDGAQPLLLSCSSVDATVPSIVDLVPAATWDEREAHDLYGVHFDGHTPLRPLVHHSPALDDWVVPVHGQGHTTLLSARFTPA